MSRRRQIGMNRFWVLVSAIIAVPLLIGLLLMIFINPNDYRGRIETAVSTAVGRQLKINGDIEVGFGFSPTITIHQIALANPPGFSRDSMASIGSIQADVSLVPLLIGKLNIGKLNVYDADVQIEVNPLGQSNADFSKPHAAKSGAAQPVEAPSDAAGSPADKLSVREIGIYGGRFASRDDQRGLSHVLIVNRAVLHSAGKDAPLNAVVDVEYDGTPVAFTAETGPVARLLGQGDLAGNWPVKLEGTSTGSQFSVVGSLHDPIAGRGYAVDVTADIADLASFSRIAGSKLPPVHGLRASFHLADDGGVPDISAVVVRSERSDLSSYVDGLLIDRLVLTASAMNQPIHAELFGSFSQQPLDAVVDVGAPRALIRALMARAAASSDAGAPMPIAVSSHVAGAEFSIKGQITNPAQLSGLSGAVDIQIPDLSALSALVGQKLPALKSLSFSTDIADTHQSGGLGVSLHKLAFDSSVGDLNGDLDIGLSPLLGVHGAITGKLLDLDALQMAAARAASTSVAPTASRARQSASRRVFTDTPIDFAPLSKADIDLKLTVGELRSGGVSYRGVDGHLVLNGGKLTVDPLSATLPGGKFSFKLGIDSQALPPEVSLAVIAPGVPLKPLLQAAGQPDDVTGNVDIGLDFVAAGRSLRALASSFTGRIGVAMADGELDNRMLGATLSDVMRVAHVPAEALVGGSGANRTKLRCAALRIDAVRGLAQVNALALQTAVAQLVGTGTLNLADETIGLSLKPGLRTPGASLVVPVRVTGTFAAPQAMIDTSVSAAAVANSVSGGLSSLTRNPLGTLTGAAKAVIANDDTCASALESARGALSASK
ncbi:MAG: AsmA family protein [Acetobacteraceae bacterium]|nr:AsmA family protein [Acetobacteraceae bacterium]